MRYRLFESDADDCDWGKSPVQWGIDIWPNRFDEDIYKPIGDDAIEEGIWVIGSLLFFNSPEERLAFVLRWFI